MGGSRHSRDKLLIEGIGTDCRHMWQILTLLWRHNGRDGVSNHQPHDRLLNLLYRCRSKKTPKLRVTGLCAGNSPVTGEFPAQMASNAENVSIWWRHHELKLFQFTLLIVFVMKHLAIRWDSIWQFPLMSHTLPDTLVWRGRV